MLLNCMHKMNHLNLIPKYLHFNKRLAKETLSGLHCKNQKEANTEGQTGGR